MRRTWFTKSDNYIFNGGGMDGTLGNKGLPSGNPMGKNPSDIWEIIVEDWQNLLWDIPNVKSNHPEKTYVKPGGWMLI
ncbi:MAG: hypothetical protein IPI12_15245 [Ignavibacteriales bacterium]|nr:hypothetical protein [Ignavibacteriales bacterium]